MKIVIIGAGPAGLTAAINAKNDKNEVIVLEKNSSVGKKLLVTGAGHCNLFNESIDITKYNSQNIEILDQIINNKNIKNVYNFFDSLGLLLKNKNGYLYPLAYNAYSVQNGLILACKNKGIKILLNQNVADVKKDNSTFTIYTDDKIYTADKLIIATGSKAYPQLGACDDAIKFAKTFNINYIDFLPSLTGLKTDNKVISRWDKLRSDVKLSYFENNQLIKEESGEVQLTNYGISGICTFNLSSHIIRNLNNAKQMIKIDFLPDVNNFTDLINKRISLFSNNNIIELLEGLINYKILYALFHGNNLLNKKNKDLTNNDIMEMEKTIKHFELNITGYNSFDNSQVCSGGILLTQINPDSFECKDISNLYYIGEALDVDGICGGYNLGFAWISGIICGTSINKD